MFVKFMFADRWEGRADHGTGVVNPTWAQVSEAIRDLDGKTKTMVLLSEKDGGDTHMGISGQWDGDFMVYATRDNVDFFSLVDASRSTNKVTLYVGGQDGEYEERKCVPLAWALETAQTFYGSGELKSQMNWQSNY
jgi:hypothetical protein